MGKKAERENADTTQSEWTVEETTEENSALGANSPSLHLRSGRGHQTPMEVLSQESLKKVIENYLEYYAHGQGHTARAKRYDLQHFLEFLAGSKSGAETVSVSSWTMQATQDFVDARLGLGEAPATVSRRLATVKHFGRTLAERVHGFINPAREVKSPSLDVTKPHGLSPEDILLLREAAKTEVERKPASFFPLRNQFLLELLLATGLRADEVRLLVFSQIGDNREWLKNVKTKGRKFRNVYLDSQVREDLNLYLEAREIELRGKCPSLFELSPAEILKIPVFVSLHGVRPEEPASFGLSPKTVWRIISDFGKKAQALSEQNIGNLHPHRLRHTFAHGLLDSSKDVRLVAQALGHSDVRTTMRYTERTEEEIARAIEKKVTNPS